MYNQTMDPVLYLAQRVSFSDDPKKCWEWNKVKDRNGYGQCHSARVAKAGGVTRAHQLSWTTFFGPIPKGLFVCHKCDNPSCVHPDHLFLGTALDNNMDCITKGRQPKEKKRSIDYDEVAALWGKYPCEKVAAMYNVSYSLVCQIWRKYGKKGRQFNHGVKQKGKRPTATEESSSINFGPSR